MRFSHIHKPHYQRESLLNGPNYFFGFGRLITCGPECKLSPDLPLFSNETFAYRWVSFCAWRQTSIHSNDVISAYLLPFFPRLHPLCGKDALFVVLLAHILWCQKPCNGFVDLALGLLESRTFAALHRVQHNRSKFLVESKLLMGLFFS